MDDAFEKSQECLRYEYGFFPRHASLCHRRGAVRAGGTVETIGAIIVTGENAISFAIVGGGPTTANGDQTSKNSDALMG